MELSAYTIASNCTDLTDVQCGINDINEAIKDLTDKGAKVPEIYVKRLRKLMEKKKKFEQHIYLVNSGEYTPAYLGRYANTKENAVKLAISLISESRGELLITQPAVVVEKYESHEYYEFSAKIKGEEDFETKYIFCLQTLKIFDPATE